MQADNELTQIKLRKYESKLAVSGKAVITFGLWSVIKAALFFITQPVDLIKALGIEEEVTATATEFAKNNVNVEVRFVVSGVILAMIFSYMILAVLLRCYIGRSAITESRGLKKKTVIYIILAVLMSISLIMALSNVFLGEPDADGNVLDAALTSRLLDLTSLIALVDLIISAVRVRRLRKKLGIVITRKKKTDLTGILEESGMEG